MAIDIEKMVLDILEKVTRIEERLEGYPELKDKIDLAYNASKNNEKDINDMKENLKWLWRTIVGAIVVGIVAYVMGRVGIK